jgi:hypothetical protein
LDLPKAGAQHEVRVNISRSPKVHPGELISVAIRPHVHVIGEATLGAQEFALLRQWVDANYDVLVKYWDGEIEYTEDAIAALKPIR